MILAAIDAENRTLYYCNAGHHPPLWLKNNSGEFELLKPTGPAIGILSEPEFRTHQIRFGPGDILLFYTDGLAEARKGHEEFGEERLQKHLLRNRESTAEQILVRLFREIKSFATNELDDLTAILVKIES